MQSAPLPLTKWLTDLDGFGTGTFKEPLPFILSKQAVTARFVLHKEGIPLKPRPAPQ
jgi:hypothetical protein